MALCPWGGILPHLVSPRLSRLLALCKHHGAWVTSVKVSMGIAVVSSADSFNLNPHLPSFP